MAKNVRAVSVIEAGPHMEEARKIGEKMYTDLVGENKEGFRAHQLFQDPYNTTGEGDPTHFICFVKGTQYHFDLWKNAIDKYKLRELEGCENYTFIKIDSKDAFLQRQRLKPIKGLNDE